MDVLHSPGIILSPVGRFSMQKVKNHLCKEADNSDKYVAFQCALFLEVSARTTLVVQIMKLPQGVIRLAGSLSYCPFQRSYKNSPECTYLVVKRRHRFPRLLWPCFIPCTCLEIVELSCFLYFCLKRGKYRASFINS